MVQDVQGTVFVSANKPYPCGIWAYRHSPGASAAGHHLSCCRSSQVPPISHVASGATGAAGHMADGRDLRRNEALQGVGWWRLGRGWRFPFGGVRGVIGVTCSELIGCNLSLHGSHRLREFECGATNATKPALGEGRRGRLTAVVVGKAVREKPDPGTLAGLRELTGTRLVEEVDSLPTSRVHNPSPHRCTRSDKSCRLPFPRGHAPGSSS
jgi:hypothetical protein